MTKERDAKKLRTPEPKIRTATPPQLETRASPKSPDRELRPKLYWDEARDGPRPAHVIKPDIAPVPCPNCDRKLLDDGLRRATIGSGSHDGKSYRKCLCCGHRFAMAIKVRTVS